MRKYLGSRITAFAAIVAPLFLCCPLLFGICALSTEISGATVFLFFGGIACAFVWGVYIKNISNQLYSWAYFTDKAVLIKTCFSKSVSMEYEKLMIKYDKHVKIKEKPLKDGFKGLYKNKKIRNG